MLTPEAFNALLKTLEEPPAHVVFIFATTDLHKVPATILSRCQRYDFKRLALPHLVEGLRRVAAGEGVDAEEEALQEPSTRRGGARPVQRLRSGPDVEAGEGQVADEVERGHVREEARPGDRQEVVVQRERPQGREPDAPDVERPVPPDEPVLVALRDRLRWFDTDSAATAPALELASL